MMRDNNIALPQKLENGLLLRWATPADAEELAAFNVRVHSDNPDDPATFLTHWVHDLMNGEHPTTKAEDFTVVVDTNNGNKIVSSLNLISQRWAYEGVEFGVGRPELVGTDPDYRRHGLVRRQMNVVHAKSAARGEMVQAITGIPWYYRQFGYEMALNLGGGRAFFWNRASNDKKVDEEPYQMRPATAADIPLLAELYKANTANSPVVRVRDEALWAYEMFATHRESPYARHVYVIETTGGECVAYTEFNHWGRAFHVRELGVRAGHPWRAVALFLTRVLRHKADELNPNRKEPIDQIGFELGEAHPVYEALGRQLEQPRAPYAWYIRLPDLPQFLRHIAPVLEQRLAASVLAGYTGTTRLNFYREQMTLVWQDGNLQEVGTFQPIRLESGDAMFPEQTFLQLLFGYRSVHELDHAFADCYLEEEARILLNILFPKRPSNVIPLG
ncbi:MAG: GNAT family N-acetyltransferase [Ardenticatenaceae bacterium]|nr:GNAT family N-acetyltransferase [Ardenticatenaceae bacterium]